MTWSEILELRVDQRPRRASEREKKKKGEGLGQVYMQKLGGLCISSRDFRRRPTVIWRLRSQQQL